MLEYTLTQIPADSLVRGLADAAFYRLWDFRVCQPRTLPGGKRTGSAGQTGATGGGHGGTVSAGLESRWKRNYKPFRTRGEQPVYEVDGGRAGEIHGGSAPGPWL